MNKIELIILKTSYAAGTIFFIWCLLAIAFGHNEAILIVRWLIGCGLSAGIATGCFLGYQRIKASLPIRISPKVSVIETQAVGEWIAPNKSERNYANLTLRPDPIVFDASSSPAQKRNAVDYALNMERAIVIGGTRSGKTFFCKQLAEYRIKEHGNLIFALDPKDYDPDDVWGEGVTCVGTGDNYHQMERFWKWLLIEKQRRGQDMRRTKKEPFILIFFDEINVTLSERPDFIAPYLAILQKFAQYRIGIWAIGQADNKDGLGLPSVALKSNFGATFLFEGDNGKDLKNYFRKSPDSRLTTPENSVLLEPYPVREITASLMPKSITASSDFKVIQKGISDIIGQSDRKFFESKAEKQAYELHKKGLSPTAISKEIFGGKSGPRVQQIRQWIS